MPVGGAWTPGAEDVQDEVPSSHDDNREYVREIQLQAETAIKEANEQDGQDNSCRANRLELQKAWPEPGFRLRGGKRPAERPGLVQEEVAEERGLGGEDLAWANTPPRPPYQHVQNDRIDQHTGGADQAETDELPEPPAPGKGGKEPRQAGQTPRSSPARRYGAVAG